MIAGRVRRKTQIGIMIGKINFASCGVRRIAARLCPFSWGMCYQPGFIDPAIKYLNKDGAMPNRMPHFRESEKWPDQ